jgi:putative acetyltransferase
MIVRHAESQRDFQAIANLMRDFVEWHYDRHAADRHIIDRYFDPGKFDLPGEFGQPEGALLVAEENGCIVSCVALRQLRNAVCEMKRMFVSPECHGQGVGLLLGRAIVQEARRLGYRRMVLDTGPAQREAQGLYRKLGFTVTKPYYELAPELRDWLVFMEMRLKS